MSNFDEEVFVGEAQGPIVRMNWETRTFSITFSEGSYKFLTDPRRIVSKKWDTVGEAHVGYLHERLRGFIDWIKTGTKPDNWTP